MGVDAITIPKVPTLPAINKGMLRGQCRMAREIHSYALDWDSMGSNYTNI